MAFKDGWNMHGIRTENNLSPLQLYSAGLMRLQRSGLEAMDVFENVIEHDYGIEPDNPVGTQEDSEASSNNLYWEN